MNICWFRRDLRLDDNKALNAALQADGETLPLFIFDSNILEELDRSDARVTFIHNSLEEMHSRLSEIGSGFIIRYGQPEKVLNDIFDEFEVKRLFFNRDYEPYARKRDQKIIDLSEKKGIEVQHFKDHVIFEPGEVLKADKNPYTVYTPYKNKWLHRFNDQDHKEITRLDYDRLVKKKTEFPSLEKIGFKKSEITVRPYDLSVVNHYKSLRDFPARDKTSYLSPHLRFGTISIRQVIQKLNANYGEDSVFLNELIWRSFFIQILYHFPKVVGENFRSKYNGIQWRNKEEEFKKWCEGKTGFPMVDAGMRQLKQTGYMHNRVRMITAGFLCKHLLIDWRWGEAYFASHLLDYELASNNGNWQWAAGTGCDAAPYFRVFNPTQQALKFDPDQSYIRKWVTEYDSLDYPDPMVDHKLARERAIERYSEGLRSKT